VAHAELAGGRKAEHATSSHHQLNGQVVGKGTTTVPAPQKLLDEEAAFDLCESAIRTDSSSASSARATGRCWCHAGA
jgi:hypothetical protein